MAKLVLDDVGNILTSQNTLNSNSSKTEAAVEKTLSRDGTSPNEMLTDLDMNSHRVINVLDAVSPTDALTLGQLNLALGDGDRLIPAGGTANQVLAKINNTNYNTHWVDGGGGTTDHLALDNIGTRTHLELESDIGQVASDLVTHEDAGTNTHSQIDTHITNYTTDSAHFLRDDTAVNWSSTTFDVLPNGGIDEGFRVLAATNTAIIRPRKAFDNAQYPGWDFDSDLLYTRRIDTTDVGFWAVETRFEADALRTGIGSISLPAHTFKVPNNDSGMFMGLDGGFNVYLGFSKGANEALRMYDTGEIRASTAPYEGLVTDPQTLTNKKYVDDGITNLNLDTTYLKLLPQSALTGTLTSRSIIPSAVDTYNIGSETNRYKALNANAIFTKQVNVPLGITYGVTSDAISQSFNMITEAGTAFTGAASKTMTLHPTNFFKGPQYNFISSFGTSKGNPSMSVVLNGAGSLNLINYFGAGAPATGSSITVAQNLYGSLMLGTLAASGTAAVAIEAGNTSSHGGCLVGGFATTLNSNGATSKIRINITSFAQGGSVAFGFSDGGLIETLNAGAWSSGYAKHATIRSAGNGAYTVGYSDGTNGSLVVSATSIIASGSGAFAQGYAQTQGNILASGDGSSAQGYAFGVGSRIDATQPGALAQGYATAGQVIQATAANASQIGVGINNEPDTFSVGTTMRLKGTVNAPITPRNGDMYVLNNAVHAYSEGVAVKLSPPAADVYTVTNPTTDRDLNVTGDNLAQVAQVLGTLIADLKLRNLLS